MEWNNIISIILGAVLAIITTFATKLFTDWYDRRTKQAQIKRFLASELSSCVSKIESFLSIYKQSQLPDPALLAALERSTRLFAGYRETAYFLDVKTSQRVLAFYDTVDHAVDIILSMLRLAQETQHESYAAKEIQRQVASLDEARSIGERLVIESNMKGLESTQSFDSKRLES
jgi:hypothetical protein